MAKMANAICHIAKMAKTKNKTKKKTRTPLPPFRVLGQI